MPLFASPSVGATDGLVFDFLQPGSRTAVGLGGDPFRSDLDDAAGWWGDFVDLPGNAVAFDAFAGRPLTPGVTGGWAAFSSEEITTRVSRETAGDGIATRFVAWLRKPESSGTWEGGSGDFRIEDRFSRAEGGVRISDEARHVTLQMTAPLWIAEDRTASPAGKIGVRLAPWPFLLLQAEAGRAPKVQEFEFDLEGETGSAALNAWVTDHRLTGRFQMAGGIHLAGSIDRDRIYEILPVQTTPRYQIFPYGGVDRRQAELGWGRADLCRFLVRWTEADADLEGEAYWSYERFGDLAYADFDLESRLVAAETRIAGCRFIVDAERARLRGKARAKIEYWPFTEAVIDMFGARRTYKATGTAEWDRFHGGFERELSRDLILRCGLTGYDIRPELEIESWRPAAFVFGRADIESDELNVERVTLGALSFGAELKPAPWVLRLDVQQIVLARVSRRAGEPEGGDGEPADGGAQEEDEADWKDGGRVRLSIAYALR